MTEEMRNSLPEWARDIAKGIEDYLKEAGEEAKEMGLNRKEKIAHYKSSLKKLELTDEEKAKRLKTTNNN